MSLIWLFKLLKWVREHAGAALVFAVAVAYTGGVWWARGQWDAALVRGARSVAAAESAERARWQDAAHAMEKAQTGTQEVVDRAIEAFDRSLAELRGRQEREVELMRQAASAREAAWTADRQRILAALPRDCDAAVRAIGTR